MKNAKYPNNLDILLDSIHNSYRDSKSKKSSQDIKFQLRYGHFSRCVRGGSGKNLRNICWKFVPGVIWCPPTIFFQKWRLFSSVFTVRDSLVFPNMQFFPLNCGVLPIIPLKIYIHSYIIMNPWTSKPFSLHSKVYLVLTYQDENYPLPPVQGEGDVLIEHKPTLVGLVSCCLWWF